MSWSFFLRFSAKNALLDAWIGPIKNPIANAINQKNETASVKKRIEVKMSKAPIHNITISIESNFFSTNPKDKHPIMPERFIKIPKNIISDSLRPKINAANILAKENMQITPLFRKKKLKRKKRTLLFFKLFVNLIMSGIANFSDL